MTRLLQSLRLTTVAGQPDDDRDPRVVPRARPGRWIAACIMLLLASMLAHMLVTNPRIQWGVVGQYLLSGPIIAGLGETMLITVVGMVMGVCIGTVAALMRQSDNPILVAAGMLYLWFFRGTPVLVQLIFWYNFAALIPSLSIGVPYGPAFVSASSNTIFQPFVAALLGLGLSEGAYMAEIIRAGILSVPKGQREAAATLGMTQLKAMRRIILPQAIRVIIPPTGNQAIGLLKTTSLVSVISLADLTYSAELIYYRNFQTIPLLIVASIWYLLITSVLTVGQHYVERHFSRRRKASDSAASGRKWIRYNGTEPVSK